MLSRDMEEMTKQIELLERKIIPEIKKKKMQCLDEMFRSLYIVKEKNIAYENIAIEDIQNKIQRVKRLKKIKK